MEKENVSSEVLDKTDLIILSILQDDGRATMKELAKATGLSIDSVHKRFKKILTKKIQISAKIYPEVYGFPLMTQNNIRIKNVSKSEREEFIKHLVKHPRVTDVVEIMGHYDMYCTIVSKDSEDLSDITQEIRHEFRNIVEDWVSTFILRTHKWDTHTML